MGLFDRFKKQVPETSPAYERLLKAKEAFDKGEYRECLGMIIEAFDQDVDYMPLYRLSADCLAKSGGQEEQVLFEQVLSQPDNFETYRQLGAHFFENGHARMAKPFLRKALSLQPTDVYTAHLLAISYARNFEMEQALSTLENIDLQKDFWAVHFLNKCRILNNKLEGVKEEVYGIRSFLEQHKENPEMDLPIQYIDELTDMLYRCRLVTAPEKDIRDWHFIQYGGAVLDYFQVPDQYVAGGRYVALWGNRNSMKSVVYKLRMFLQAISKNISVVAALPDRNSAITGRVIAAELGCRFITYTPDCDPKDMLVVSADTDTLNRYEELSTIKNGQLLFALNHCWLKSAMITPDIIGFMTQNYWFPWDEGQMRVNDMTKETERAPADTRDDITIANEIFHAEKEEQDISALMTFYRNHAHALKGIGEHATLRRYNFLVESPVPGSYFHY